jgi:hypothetical protein
LENLLSAGVTNQVFSKNKNELSLDEQNVMGQLASLGYKKYLSSRIILNLFLLRADEYFEILC